MSTLLEHLRTTSDTAGQRLNDAAEQKRREKVERERARLDAVETRIRQSEWPRVTQELRTVAELGLRQYRITILSWSDVSSSPETDRAIAVYQELLAAEGLPSRVSASQNDPVGSDPLFDHTVYNLDLIVEW